MARAVDAYMCMQHRHPLDTNQQLRGKKFTALSENRWDRRECTVPVRLVEKKACTAARLRELGAEERRGAVRLLLGLSLFRKVDEVLGAQGN